MEKPVLPPSDWLCHSSVLFRKWRKIHPRGVRVCGPKRLEEKRGPHQFWLLFLYVSFRLPGGLPCVNWASQRCCMFQLRFSLWSSDLPLFYFAGVSLPCLLATTIWTRFFSFFFLFSYSNCLTSLSRERPLKQIPIWPLSPGCPQNVDS